MNTLGEALDIHSINVKNISDILAYGTKAQILGLVKVYNGIASKAGIAPLNPSDLAVIIKSRGLSGYGDIDWSSIGSMASSIGSGLAQAAQAVGPLIIQKYQIDKLPSATPATPAAVAANATTGVPAVKGGGSSNLLLYGGGALAVGALAYFAFFRKRSR